jgi:hypothetical protein
LSEAPTTVRTVVASSTIMMVLAMCDFPRTRRR